MKCKVIDGTLRDIEKGINELLEEDANLKVVSNTRLGNRSLLVVIYKPDPSIAKKRQDAVEKAELLQKKALAEAEAKAAQDEANVVQERAKIFADSVKKKYGDTKEVTK